jgi:hypothetical protein
MTEDYWKVEVHYQVITVLFVKKIVNLLKCGKDQLVFRKEGRR